MTSQRLPESLPTHIDLATYISGPAVLLTPVNVAGSEIPAGFVTDLASTPQLLWWVFPPWGRYLFAALVHDYHYQKQIISRKRADELFLHVMGWYGVKPWRKWAMYGAVRLFGWHAWRRNKKSLSDIGCAFGIQPTKDEE